MNRNENRRRRLILLTLVLAGVAAFIPGITLPMMTVKKLVLVKNTFTVLSGIGAPGWQKNGEFSHTMM